MSSEKEVNVVRFLVKNLYIYLNYEQLKQKYNKNDRRYIRDSKNLYISRVINSLQVFKGKSEEEIKELLLKALED